MGQVTLAASVGTSNSHATGRPAQCHLFYGTNSGYWWLFVFISTQTLATYYSSNFSTWTAGATLTLTKAHASEGRNLSLCYANLGSTDVVHIETSYFVSGTTSSTYHTRATISGTTVTFGTETQVTANTSYGDSSYTFDGSAVGIDSAGKITVLSGYLTSSFGGDLTADRSTNADSGTSWTAGFPTTATDVATATDANTSNACISLGSGNSLAVGDNASTDNNFTQLLFGKWTGSSWATTGNVLASALGTAQNANDWNAILVGSSVYCVYRTGTNTYAVRTFATGGTTWAAGTAPPNQTSLAGGGIGLATDGTNLWMLVIDSASGNPIQYNKFTVSGATWGTWTALESSSATRNNLSVYQTVSSSNIGVCWTQTNGSNYDVDGETLALSSTFTVSMTGGMTESEGSTSAAATYAPASSGGETESGAASEIAIYDPSSIGGETAGGNAATAATYSPVSFGGENEGGSAVPAAGYSPVSTGGEAEGGSGAASAIYALVGSGGETESGSAPIAMQWFPAMHGGEFSGGSASVILDTGASFPVLLFFNRLI